MRAGIVMNDGTRRQRRGDTRRRVQETALALFSEQGYERTSLREIAEALDVTKAALYYHFRAKEDILISLFEDLTRPIDELVEWARRQPPSLETKQEFLLRYSRALTAAAPLIRFMQENQAAVRELRIGGMFKDRVTALMDVLQEPGASLPDRVRCVSALITMHLGLLALKEAEGDPESKHRAVLTVATELIAQAHGASAPPCPADPPETAERPPREPLTS
ncbi:TetR/AcrR family transcriptional regulator [Streptomyces sp. SID2888]|uniref:TetR/AcrR family transcriptional regulator n=1 Tax=Streptomyces sp. SID2888 TaxID=2690256 RepID=UPI001F26A6D6|nr:TetR/AcrR family transcriptional regulator [Streptomyces sp. SID2888]